MCEVGPAVLGRDRGQAHVDPLPGASPRRVGEREPRHARPEGGARDDHALRVDAEERVLGQQPREVLQVVHLVGAVAELRLAGRAAAGAVHEPARGVAQDDIAARGEPGVVVVPLLPAGVDRPAPLRLRARAAAVQQDDQRVAAGGARVPPGVRQGDVRVERDEAPASRRRRPGRGARLAAGRGSPRTAPARAPPSRRPRSASGRRPAAARRRRSGRGSGSRSSGGRRARRPCGSSPSESPGRLAPRRARAAGRTLRSGGLGRCR